MTANIGATRFNPLDRGNLYQNARAIIWDSGVIFDETKGFQSPRSGDVTVTIAHVTAITARGFNPLDRGNLYLINIGRYVLGCEKSASMFQSPRSGKFVSNLKIW